MTEDEMVGWHHQLNGHEFELTPRVRDGLGPLPDLQRGIAPLGPPVSAQARLLGLGVAPPGRCPWPRAWGHGVAPPSHRSWPGVGLLLPATAPDLGRRVAPLVTTPDLGRGVAPLIRSCTVAA